MGSFSRFIVFYASIITLILLIVTIITYLERANLTISRTWSEHLECRLDDQAIWIHSENEDIIQGCCDLRTSDCSIPIPAANHWRPGLPSHWPVRSARESFRVSVPSARPGHAAAVAASKHSMVGQPLSEPPPARADITPLWISDPVLPAGASRAAPRA